MRERLLRYRPDPVRFDRALAAVLTVAFWVETWTGGDAEGHRIALSIGGTLTTVAVAFRRRYPAVVGIGSALLAVVLQTFWPSGEIAYGIAWFCNMYALAVWTPTRVFALGLLAYAASALVLALLPVGKHGGGEHGLKHTAPFVVVSTVVMLLVRRVLGDRERRVLLAERERDVAAREAVVEERARIARELHDAIAHSVSVMVVQAGAERRVSTATGSTREVLQTIEQIGRGALTEMRRLVGMLQDGRPRSAGAPARPGRPRDARRAGARGGAPGRAAASRGSGGSFR